MKLFSYVTLHGNAEEAMELYARALGGEIAFVQRYRDVPTDQYPTPAGWEDKIMHANIKGPDFELMVSDGSPAHPTTFGNALSVTVVPDSVEEGEKIFAALAEGGKISMPYGPVFWGATFGMLTDRFGIQWMVNVES